MKSSIVLITTIILIGICDASVFGGGVEKCRDPNEENNNCGNPCLEKCDDGQQNPCTLACSIECSCKIGYKRHPNATCVLESECPKVNHTCHAPNTEWKEGNDCSEACDGAVKLCEDDTYFRCFCKEGYLLDPNTYLCIPEGQCPVIGQDSECNDTKMYRCGNDCWDYCDDGALRKCSGNCRYGCYCKTGFKLNPETSECVPPEKCPPKPKRVQRSTCSGPYEIFKEDGSPCADKCNKDLVRCANDQKPGCYCIDGYARDLTTGVCRPYPCKECGENAEWVNCAGSCDNHCDFVFGRDTCKINHIKCPDGCRCKEGFARTTNSTESPCIQESSCV